MILIIVIVLHYLDKVATGTYIFLSVIVKADTLFRWRLIQYFDKIRIRWILQLIKDILRVFQNLIKYFKSTALPAFIIPALLVLPINLIQV